MSDYRDEKIDKDAQTVSDLVNNFNFSPVKVALRLGSEHRTLQQNIMRFCVAFIEMMASKEIGRDTDARNEDSVRLAKKLLANIDERDRYLSRI